MAHGGNAAVYKQDINGQRAARGAIGRRRELLAAGPQHEGRDDDRPDGCGEARPSDGGEEAVRLDEPAEQGRQEGHEGRFGPAHDGVIELAQVGHVVEKSEPRAKERGRHREEGKRLQHTEDEAAVDTGTGCTDEVPDIAARSDDGLELLARDDPVGGHNPRHITDKGNQRTIAQALVDVGRP